MSLLSKLLGGKKPTLTEVVDLLQGKGQPPTQPAPPANRGEAVYPAYPAYGEETPIGRSWGERMPNEPNQFNYPGTYREYFEDIFHREFAAFRVVPSENPRSDKVIAYTFYQGERTALVIELAWQGSGIYMLRQSCMRLGVPYLRFYYDHEGWWNARSYVVARISKALGG